MEDATRMFIKKSTSDPISWSPMEMQTMCMFEKAEAAGLSCNSGSHLMDYQIPLQIVSIYVCVRRTLLQTPHKNP
jgi:hypothetical protein